MGVKKIRIMDVEALSAKRKAAVIGEIRRKDIWAIFMWGEPIRGKRWAMPTGSLPRRLPSHYNKDDTDEKAAVQCHGGVRLFHAI